MSITLEGNYVTTDPSKWKPRTKLNVVTGAGLGEQSRKSHAMINILMAQKELLTSGSGLVNENSLYKALLVSAKYSGIDYPESYFVDPDSPEAQQAAQAKQHAAQAEAQKQEQMLIAQAHFQKTLVDITEETKRMKAQMDLLNAKLDRDLDIEKEMNKFAIEQAKIEAAGEPVDIPGGLVS